MEWPQLFTMQCGGVTYVPNQTPGAHPVTGTLIGPCTAEPVIKERELLDYSQPDFIVGVRLKLHVELVTCSDRFWGSGSYSTLEDVLNKYFDGTNATLNVWTYTGTGRAAHIESMEREKLEGKNLGLKVSLDFKSVAILKGHPTSMSVTW